MAGGDIERWRVHSRREDRQVKRSLSSSTANLYVLPSFCASTVEIPWVYCNMFRIRVVAGMLDDSAVRPKRDQHYIVQYIAHNTAVYV